MKWHQKACKKPSYTAVNHCRTMAFPALLPFVLITPTGIGWQDFHAGIEVSPVMLVASLRCNEPQPSLV